MRIGHCKEIWKLTFLALALHPDKELRANTRNVSFWISLWWLIRIIKPVDKTKLSWYVKPSVWQHCHSCCHHVWYKVPIRSCLIISWKVQNIRIKLIKLLQKLQHTNPFFQQKTSFFTPLLGFALIKLMGLCVRYFQKNTSKDPFQKERGH